MRQALDLEHWAAFPDSFERVVRRLGDVAAGRLGRAPSTVLVLSGDVHHSYVAPVRFPDDPAARSPVVQVVSSPLRNALPSAVRRGFRAAASRPARVLGRALARSAGLRPPSVDWDLRTGPLTGNGLGRLVLDGRSARLSLHAARLRDERAVLEQVHAEQVGPGPAGRR